MSIKSEEARRKALLMSKENECKDEVLRLLELFEEKKSRAHGFMSDEMPYMMILSEMVIYRAGF